MIHDTHIAAMVGAPRIPPPPLATCGALYPAQYLNLDNFFLGSTLKHDKQSNRFYIGRLYRKKHIVQRTQGSNSGLSMVGSGRVESSRVGSGGLQIPRVGPGRVGSDQREVIRPVEKWKTLKNATLRTWWRPVISRALCGYHKSDPPWHLSNPGCFGVGAIYDTCYVRNGLLSCDGHFSYTSSLLPPQLRQGFT